MRINNLIVICLLGVLATPTIADESQATSGKSVKLLIALHFPENYDTMKAIAQCESELVHRKNGDLLQNSTGSSARGTFQLLMSVHRPEMKRLGLDPNNDDEYMKYVRYLVKHYGLTPWAESYNCWRKKVKT